MTKIINCLLKYINYIKICMSFNPTIPFLDIYPIKILKGARICIG